MEVTVAADVIVDLASKDDLRQHHDKMAKLLEKPHGRIRRPFASGATGSGFSGAGPVYLTFDPIAPPGGRMWLVQWIAVWVGSAPAAGAVANLFAALAVGNAPRGSLSDTLVTGPAVNLADVVGAGFTVPTGSQGSMPDKVWVSPQDQLYLILQGSGLAASTRYSATAGVLDLPDTPEALLW